MLSVELEGTEAIWECDKGEIKKARAWNHRKVNSGKRDRQEEKRSVDFQIFSFQKQQEVIF